MNIRRLLWVLPILIIVGCSKQDSTASVDKLPLVSVQPAPLPSATSEDWRKALESSYVVTNKSDEGDGVTKFFACFRQIDAKKCGNWTSASRDAFRERYFFKSGFASSFPTGNYVVSYLSLGNDERPSVMLAPVFNGRSWLFIKKISFLLDGEIVLEKDFEHFKVDRDTHGAGVTERSDFFATEEQIAALRKIGQESNLLVRLTGDKGYVSLNKKEISDLKGEIANLLFVYDKINQALDGNVPSEPTQRKS